ncbi:MAG: hypothetical protein ABSH32_31410 [Bryobacteraceae bacterium]|jgi:hypothetical protein
MRIGICVLIALAAAMTAAPEPKPEEIARSVMQAMGGQEAWARARFIRFDFIVKIGGQESITRSHLWEKQTGRCRLEDKAGNGAPAVVLFNTGNQQGTAYVSGKKLEGEAATAALKGSQRTFLYDLYWLAMPWMWLDPGVHLKYLGRKTLSGSEFDVVELTFDEGGPRSGDRYDAYVSPKSHLMEHWEYIAKSGERSAWDWQYTTTGGIKLASDHTNNEKRASIGMGDVRVLDKVDDAFLTDPGRRLVQLGK